MWVISGFASFLGLIQGSVWDSETNLDLPGLASGTYSWVCMCTVLESDPQGTALDPYFSFSSSALLQVQVYSLYSSNGTKIGMG